MSGTCGRRTRTKCETVTDVPYTNVYEKSESGIKVKKTVKTETGNFLQAFNSK